jgi:hypothetical protein
VDKQGSIPDRGWAFSLRHHVQISLCISPAIDTIDTKRYFTRVN